MKIDDRLEKLKQFDTIVMWSQPIRIRILLVVSSMARTMAYG